MLKTNVNPSSIDLSVNSSLFCLLIIVFVILVLIAITISSSKDRANNPRFKLRDLFAVPVFIGTILVLFSFNIEQLRGSHDSPVFEFSERNYSTFYLFKQTFMPIDEIRSIRLRTSEHQGTRNGSPDGTPTISYNVELHTIEKKTKKEKRTSITFGRSRNKEETLNIANIIAHFIDSHPIVQNTRKPVRYGF